MQKARDNLICDDNDNTQGKCAPSCGTQIKKRDTDEEKKSKYMGKHKENRKSY